MTKNIIMSLAIIVLCASCSTGQSDSGIPSSASRTAAVSQAVAVPQSVEGQSEEGHEGDTSAHDKATHHKPSHDEPRPYDKKRNAMADVDATLSNASASGKMSLLVLGANWCHDSRGLAARFEKENFISLISDHYELLYVDVGKRDRNLDVAKRFGIYEIIGTPTVLVLNSDGELLNADTASDWRRAASISDEETYSYFSNFTDAQ